MGGMGMGPMGGIIIGPGIMGWKAGIGGYGMAHMGCMARGPTGMNAGRARLGDTGRAGCCPMPMPGGGGPGGGPAGGGPGGGGPGGGGGSNAFTGGRGGVGGRGGTGGGVGGRLGVEGGVLGDGMLSSPSPSLFDDHHGGG